MLLIDGVKFDLWTPKDEEKEFHPMVRANYRDIFDEDALYFDVKHVLKTPSKIGSIPDAYVVSFGHNEWFVVENELSSHPIYDHIVNQLTKFLNGIKTQETRSQIMDALYQDIEGDEVCRAQVQKQIGTHEIHQALSDLIMKKQPRIVVIIDAKTPEVDEALQNLYPIPSIVEFKTYVRRDAHNIRAHIFESIYAPGKPTGKTLGRLEEKKPVPDYYKTWEKKLEWVDQNVRDVRKALTNRIEQFANVSQKASGPDYIFYKEISGKKIPFVGLFLTKPTLKVRIRTDPTTLKDPKKWVSEKTYNWFFRMGNEKEFRISSVDQIDYALELIKQSYDLAK
jgi:predicted transport protein